MFPILIFPKEYRKEELFNSLSKKSILTRNLNPSYKNQLIDFFNLI